jgi:hypothetical protein
MTKPMNGSNPATEYAGAASIDGDLPSFWTSVVRYRQRHGLFDLKRQSASLQGLIDDDDLCDLRDKTPARDFAFEPSPSADPSNTSNT